MDFRTPPPFLTALQERLEHGVFGYEIVPPRLRIDIVKWQEDRHGWNLNADHILREPNILNSLAIAASVPTSNDDGIIVQPPVSFDFYDILKENNRKIITNPLILENGVYRLDFDGLVAVASHPRNKMIYLCNPHNPIGRVWSRAYLKRLGDICNLHGAIVVTDEIHAEINFLVAAICLTRHWAMNTQKIQQLACRPPSALTSLLFVLRSCWSATNKTEMRFRPKKAG